MAHKVAKASYYAWSEIMAESMTVRRTFKDKTSMKRHLKHSLRQRTMIASGLSTRKAKGGYLVTRCQIAGRGKLTESSPTLLNGRIVNSYYTRSKQSVARATEGATETDGGETSVGITLEEEKPERPSERFMVLDLGEADCTNCGYHYDPKRGDSEYPIASGTLFSNLPGDWNCPLCGAEKDKFRASAKEIAGFAENQGYGFGTNSMTAGQKNLLIYGSLLFFFALFLSGYFLD